MRNENDAFAKTNCISKFEWPATFLIVDKTDFLTKWVKKRRKKVRKRDGTEARHIAVNRLGKVDSCGKSTLDACHVSSLNCNSLVELTSTKVGNRLLLMLSSIEF